MSKSTIILDSSVIAKWFFPEEDSDIALGIKERFASGKLSITIPVLLYYEINNILRTGAKFARINSNDILKTYQSFLNLNFIAYSTADLLVKTLEIALKYDISSYDASYIALAEHLQIPFLTADQKLINKVTSKYIFNLKNYKLEILK